MEVGDGGGGGPTLRQWWWSSRVGGLDGDSMGWGHGYGGRGEEEKHR